MIKPIKTIVGCGVISFILLSFTFYVQAFNNSKSGLLMKEPSNKLIENYMPKNGCSLKEIALPKECHISFDKECDINYEKPQPKTEVPVSKPSKKDILTSRMSRGGDISTYKLDNIIEMSSEERQWLEKLVEAESADEPYEGKLAVSTTIANRIRDAEFPDNIMGVIKQNLPESQYHQYSPWDDGSIYERTPSLETKKAIIEVFDNGIRVLPSDTVYFYAPKYSPHNWIQDTRKEIVTIGGHIFCSKYEK